MLFWYLIFYFGMTIYLRHLNYPIDFFYHTAYRRGYSDIGKKMGRVGYWATSISTVRTTVLSKKVIKTIKTDLFPDLDITQRILDDI